MEASAEKYFIFLIYAVGYQVSPFIYLFFKYPLTTILNFKLSILPSYSSFALCTPIHGFTGYPFYGSCTINLWLLVMFIISFLLVLWWLIQNSWILEESMTLLHLIFLREEMNYIFILQKTWRPYVDVCPSFLLSVLLFFIHFGLT